MSLRGYIIGDGLNETSNNAIKKCFSSLWDTESDVTLEYFKQTSPETLQEDIEKDLFPIKWNYPLNNESKKDEEFGMILKPYRTNSMEKVFACTISHARLWKLCVETSEEIMILEHDAIFTRKIEKFEWEGGVLGLNDPRGATHSSGKFHSVVASSNGIKEAPWVEDPLSMPQGLAGNSAYIIKPYFAEKLLNKLEQKGGWPNDAIMCKQFFKGELKVVYPYYTTIQGVQSTTTL